MGYLHSGLGGCETRRERRAAKVANYRRRFYAGQYSYLTARAEAEAARRQAERAQADDLHGYLLRGDYEAALAVLQSLSRDGYIPTLDSSSGYPSKERCPESASQLQSMHQWCSFADSWEDYDACYGS